jgi:MerR family transcriptional regulator/heat shock protein HspR
MSAEVVLYTLGDAGQLTGLHPEQIREFERAGLVCPAATSPRGDPLFNDGGLCRVRLLADLRLREKLSLRMIRAFCQLIDKLERAEAEIKNLKQQLKSRPACDGVG